MTVEKSETFEAKRKPDEEPAAQAQGASVIARLIDLRMRLKGIGDALAGGQLSVEAPATVPNIGNQPSEVDAPRNPAEELANLEKRMDKLGVATQAVVDEIHERPAFDPGDVRGLIDKLDAWRRARTQSDWSPVANKATAIARPLDRLPEAGRLEKVARIQNELRELTDIAASQNLSGLDLVGLRMRLAEVGEMLAALNGASVVKSNAAVVAHASDPAEKATDAFDALQSALAGLVEEATAIEPAAKELPIATGGDTPGPQRISAKTVQPSGNAFLRRPSCGSGDTGSQMASRAPPRTVSAALVAMIEQKPEGVVADPGPTIPSSADATHTYPPSGIGRLVGWRKAKAAVVARDPRKS